MRKKATVCSAFVALFLISVCAMTIFAGAADDDGVSSAQPTADSWPMFHHDLTHTGISGSAAPSTNQTLWKFNTGGQMDSPTVAGGVVYVGSYDHKVYALNASTGAPIWSYETGSVVLSPAAVAEGIVYVGSEDNKVYALNATTGAYIWSYTTGYYVDSALAVSDGVVYAVSEDQKVYALDAHNGALIWNYTTGGMIMMSSPAVAGGKVYVGSLDGKVYALNAKTGAYAWSYTTGDSIISSPAVAGNMVYVGSNDKNVYALNAINRRGRVELHNRRCRVVFSRCC